VLFPNSSRGLWYLWLGPLWAVLYYVLFRTLILRMNLKTPGREIEDVTRTSAAQIEGSFAAQLVAAFGGAQNILGLDACITRLRVELREIAAAHPDALRSLGASGVVQVGNNMQAIFGTRSENLKTDMEEYMLAETGSVPNAPARRDSNAIRAALGGTQNIVQIDVAALTRLRVQVRDLNAVDERALEAAGADGMMRISSDVVHVIVGPDAEQLAGTLKR
jgi:PTS system glucose-specific IIC component